MNIKTNSKHHSYLVVVLLLFSLKAFSSETDEFFEKYRELRSKIQVLVGEFVQKSIYPDEIYTTSGRVIYVRPDRLIFSTKEPNKTTILDGKRIYEYDVEIKQVAIYDLTEKMDTEIFFIAFTEDIERLKDRYKINKVVVDDERGRDGISIKPIDEQDKEGSFKEILILLRSSDYLPYRIRMINTEDVQTLMDFEKIETNCKISPKDTQMFVPAGTTIVVNDRLTEVVGEGGKYIPEPANIPQELIKSSEQEMENKPENNKEVPDKVIVEKDLLPTPQFQEKR